MDSGSSSGVGSAGAGAEPGVAVAEASGVSAAAEDVGAARAPTSLGSSVDVAMSSRREVAASSLERFVSGRAHRYDWRAGQEQAAVVQLAFLENAYRLMSVVRLCMWFAAAMIAFAVVVVVRGFVNVRSRGPGGSGARAVSSAGVDG